MEVLRRRLTKAEKESTNMKNENSRLSTKLQQLGTVPAVLRGLQTAAREVELKLITVE